MALAILELLALDQRAVAFRIDTGTNRYYCLKIGRSTRRRAGIEWVDEVAYVTPLVSNHVGGGLLNTWTEVSVPATRFQHGNVHAQLFTFKTADGISPAFSRVVTIPVGLGPPTDAPSFSGPAAMPSTLTSDSFLPARAVPCRTYADAYARTASWDDLLASLVKVAAPVVLDLLAGSAQHAPQKNGSAPPASPPQPGTAPQANLVALLLHALLGGGASGALASPAVSQSLSGGSAVLVENRFLHPEPAGLSQTFFWPALLTAVAPALVQVLPQLMNAANQRRIQLKQADDKLITDLLSEVDRGMLLEKLLEAQRQAPAAGGAGSTSNDLNALIQLLQQMPAASGAPAAASAPTVPAGASAPLPTAASASLSLSTDGVATATLSSKAVVTFVTAPPIAWNGTPTVLFAKNRPLQLKVRLTVAEPAPTSALPKAIVKITFKGGAHQSVWGEKTFKERNVLAGSVVSLPFTPDELAHLPSNQPITAFAEMRWLTPSSGREHRALGSLELVLVDNAFLKEVGQASGPERELSDMQRFRPFWNKIWEAPTLQATGGGQDDARKYTWELDVTAKYTVLLSTDHPANGLMQTKLLRRPQDPDSLTDTTEGRMKAGIELSVAELNKLLPLWDSHPVLEPDELAAMATDVFTRNTAGECISNLKLKGRAGQRGMIWVIPVFKPFDVTLGVLQTTDDAGQVLAAGDEKVQFPLPVAARVIGLKAQDSADTSATDQESAYAFDGFTVEFSEKVMLTPPGREGTAAAGYD